MILYTRAAGGELRGAMLSWQQVELDADTLAERFALSIDDRGLPLVPLCNVIGLQGLAIPLLRSGGTVVILRDRDTAQALRALGRQGVTTIVAKPADYQQLMSAGLHGLPLERLRCLLALGAPCPVSLIDAYAEHGLRLRVGYVHTEVGPGCFSFGPQERPHSVGKPVPGSMARVVDADGSELRRGEVGELWLKGPHLSPGYWGQSDERDREADDDGWFRTGDCACRDEEGWYYVVEREADYLQRERAHEACAREQV
jgi:fatty-acyl-CoA synthase